MNTSIRSLAVAVTLLLGALVVPAAPAAAAVPAPHCESGGSRFFCLGSSTGTTTWHVTIVFPPATDVIYTTAGPNLSTRCPNPGRGLQVFYTFVSNGVTEISGNTSFWCNPGQWT
ncbi:hypothetical protein Rhe02_08240 [Rhizocola hellebori]|uniref:Secreted protein n=1 Tax=Rhizocola hellebori TaxID=1392758 RepID=A0A8J3VDU2_9ACTN|nr:hypothetical protein [Rhizocola hellebori]GIH02757.1 hypothetical protein Rhe02_08240 [Rhizocola hellebori]